MAGSKKRRAKAAKKQHHNNNNTKQHEVPPSTNKEASVEFEEEECLESMADEGEEIVTPKTPGKDAEGDTGMPLKEGAVDENGNGKGNVNISEEDEGSMSPKTPARDTEPEPVNGGMHAEDASSAHANEEVLADENLAVHPEPEAPPHVVMDSLTDETDPAIVDPPINKEESIICAGNESDSTAVVESLNEKSAEHTNIDGLESEATPETLLVSDEPQTASEGSPEVLQEEVTDAASKDSPEAIADVEAPSTAETTAPEPETIPSVESIIADRDTVCQEAAEAEVLKPSDVAEADTGIPCVNEEVLEPPVHVVKADAETESLIPVDADEVTVAAPDAQPPPEPADQEISTTNEAANMEPQTPSAIELSDAEPEASLPSEAANVQPEASLLVDATDADPEASLPVDATDAEPVASLPAEATDAEMEASLPTETTDAETEASLPTEANDAEVETPAPAGANGAEVEAPVPVGANDAEGEALPPIEATDAERETTPATEVTDVGGEATHSTETNAVEFRAPEEQDSTPAENREADIVALVAEADVAPVQALATEAEKVTEREIPVSPPPEGVVSEACAPVADVLAAAVSESAEIADAKVAGNPIPVEFQTPSQMEVAEVLDIDAPVDTAKEESPVAESVEVSEVKDVEADAPQPAKVKEVETENHALVGTVEIKEVEDETPATIDGAEVKEVEPETSSQGEGSLMEEAEPEASSQGEGSQMEEANGEPIATELNEEVAEAPRAVEVCEAKEAEIDTPVTVEAPRAVEVREAKEAEIDTPVTVEAPRAVEVREAKEAEIDTPVTVEAPRAVEVREAKEAEIDTPVCEAKGAEVDTPVCEAKEAEVDTPVCEAKEAEIDTPVTVEAVVDSEILVPTDTNHADSVEPETHNSVPGPAPQSYKTDSDVIVSQQEDPLAQTVGQSFEVCTPVASEGDSQPAESQIKSVEDPSLECYAEHTKRDVPSPEAQDAEVIQQLEDSFSEEPVAQEMETKSDHVGDERKVVSEQTNREINVQPEALEPDSKCVEDTPIDQEQFEVETTLSDQEKDIGEEEATSSMAVEVGSVRTDFDDTNIPDEQDLENEHPSSDQGVVVFDREFDNNLVDNCPISDRATSDTSDADNLSEMSNQVAGIHSATLPNGEHSQFLKNSAIATDGGTPEDYECNGEAHSVSNPVEDDPLSGQAHSDNQDVTEITEEQITESGAYSGKWKQAAVIPEETIEVFSLGEKSLAPNSLKTVDDLLPTSTAVLENGADKGEVPMPTSTPVLQNGTDKEEVPRTIVSTNSIVGETTRKAVDSKPPQTFLNQSSQAASVPVTVAVQKDRVVDNEAAISASGGVTIARRTNWFGCCGLLDVLLGKD